MNINDSNVFNFAKSFYEHQQDINKNKSQLESACQRFAISKDKKELEFIKTNLQNLFNNIEEFKLDCEQVKKISSNDHLAEKMTSVLKTPDIFQILDFGKQTLNSAKDILELAERTLQSSNISYVKTAVLPKKEGGESKSYELFDQLWDNQKISPDEFLVLGKSLLTEYQKDPTHLETLTRAHQCWEKAAELYEKEGNFKEAFAIRSHIVTEMRMPDTHPLYTLEKKMDDYRQKANLSQDLGAKFDGLDAGVLKRGILSVRKRQFEGEKEKLVTNFHISQFALEKLRQTLREIERNPKEFADSLPDDLKGQVTVKKVGNGYFGKKENGYYSRDFKDGIRLGEAIEIKLGDSGVLRIAADEQYASMANRVTIEINADESPGKSLNSFQGIATMLGLGPIFGVENPEEEERKKIALLFRTFYPREAYQLENMQKYYEMSPENLKKLIVKSKPEMAKILDHYLSGEGKMEKVTIAPEISVWSIPDLDDLLRQKGAVGLMMGFTGDPEILVAVLTNGPKCSQERYEAALLKGGTSPGQDHIHGGAGFTFSRLINQKMVNTKKRQYIEASDSYEDRPVSFVQRYPHFGEYQILYDLSSLNTGAYAYNEDYYGSKSPARYGQRKSLIEFVESLDENSVKNEVMIRERIAPDKISKILVSSFGKKENLIDNLKEKGLLIEKEGKSYIRGYETQDIDQLIIVGRYFTQAMWE